MSDARYVLVTAEHLSKFGMAHTQRSLGGLDTDHLSINNNRQCNLDGENNPTWQQENRSYVRKPLHAGNWSM